MRIINTKESKLLPVPLLLTNIFGQTNNHQPNHKLYNSNIDIKGNLELLYISKSKSTTKSTYHYSLTSIFSLGIQTSLFWLCLNMR